MCKTTREIESRPDMQRRLLEIRRMADELAKFIRDILAAKNEEGSDGVASGHAG